MKYTWNIPSLNGESEPTNIPIEAGSVLFVVGPNGAGKSALITHIAKSCREIPVVRIAAHRQSWLTSSSVELTAKSRKDVERNISSRDQQDDSRWKDDYAGARSQAALFDLANAENQASRKIVDLLKQGKKAEADKQVREPSPIDATNEILRLSTLSVQLSMNDDGDIFARHGSNPEFSITHLSDGERNAVMLAAQTLTAVSGSLFLIDEPERHLHRSISEPMLTALFEKRKDCAFVISTHEPDLPGSNPDAPVVIVRKCSWNGATASGWDLDILPPDVDIPEDTRKAILGSRRAILFVEGSVQSLDFPLYSALFPHISVVPVGNCRDVDNAVSGLSESAVRHWLQPVGLVDRDDRTDEDVSRLAERRVFALDVSSIESIFYSTDSVQALAQVQATTHGGKADELIAKTLDAAFAELDEETRKNLAARRSEKTARNRGMAQLPDWKTIRELEGATITIEVEPTFRNELERLISAIEDRDWDTVVARYSIKNSGAPSAIASALKFVDRRHFEEAVVSLAKRDDGFREALRTRLGLMVEHIDGLTDSSTNGSKAVAAAALA